LGSSSIRSRTSRRRSRCNGCVSRPPAGTLRPAGGAAGVRRRRSLGTSCPGAFCLVRHACRRGKEGNTMAIALDRHYIGGNGVRAGPAATLSGGLGARAQIVDLKFCDLLGTWQHCSLPLSAFDESAFTDGLGFDGSSIRGWKGISESDMLLMPIAASALIDPFCEAPTLSLLCEIADPVTREPYTRDPRGVATRAEALLQASGIPDTAFFGPECEFFVFDEVSYELGPNRSHYVVDSPEGHWNSGKPGLGYTVREKEGYFPPAPHDTLSDLRTEMV